ncbi:MAG: hypothetical protein ACFB9N_08075 [Geitlerinemataceae cyanobacterium]
MAPVAFITGAPQSSSLAIARRFAREGDDLVLAARQPDRLKATATGWVCRARLQPAPAAMLSRPQ